MILAKAGQYLNFKNLKLDTWAESVKSHKCDHILSVFTLSALLSKHTMVHLRNGNMWMTVDTPNCDHDELFAKCDIHQAHIGNGLFAELRPITHSVLVPPAGEIDPGTITADVLNKSSGTTLSTSMGISSHDVPDSSITMTKSTGTTSHNESSSEVILRRNSVPAAPEPILAGTVSGIMTMTPQEHAHTLSGTTIEESGESGNLSGTTTNIGTSNVETIEVTVGSIKADPAMTEMLVSEGNLTPSDVPKMPKTNFKQ